jgi:hypothetical protein
MAFDSSFPEANARSLYLGCFTATFDSLKHNQLALHYPILIITALSSF